MNLITIVGAGPDEELNIYLTPNSDLLSLTSSAAVRTDGVGFYHFWVNGTSLSSDMIGTTMPTTPFPHKRLAGIGGMNSTYCSVYDQMNATTLMEHLWQADNGVWIPTAITVETD